MDSSSQAGHSDRESMVHRDLSTPSQSAYHLYPQQQHMFQPSPQPHQQPSRRHQEYQQQQQQHQQYQSQGPSRSPAPRHAQAYPAMYNMNMQPHYYGHYPHMPYPSHRWQYPPPYPNYTQMQHHQQHQSPMPPQHHQYQPPYPRQPMIVSSQGMNAPARPFMPSSSSYNASRSTPHAADTSSSQSAQTEKTKELAQPTQASSPAPAPQDVTSTVPAQPASYTKTPFYPNLPWYYPADSKDSFIRPARPKRKRRNRLRSIDETITLPSRDVEPIPRPQDAHDSTIADKPASESDNTEDDKQDTGPPIATPHSAHSPSQQQTSIIPALPNIASSHLSTKSVDGQGAPTTQDTAEPSKPALSPTTPAPPKSWAELVRSKTNAPTQAPVSGTTAINGVHDSQKSSTAEVLDSFRVGTQDKICFLKPHGLINTGNMCYMNSILQVLVFCTPFYDFLDRTSKQAVHSFKSDTPLIEAMIMFMREFEVIDSAESADKLRLRLKSEELEQYGQAFTPEYVYDAIKRLPRFSTMRRGHQQDAEEFLGFLLAGLHDECTSIQHKTTKPSAPVSEGGHSADVSDVSNSDGWLEVGPKQRAAVTRQSGDSATMTPITRVFGGTLRSELRVPGNKTSVTLEPYQPLQLDIGASDVRNIQEALTGLTKPESLTGAFNSPRGPGTTATKQVFIETLPPVLILHLKRFQYDSYGGTQKIWKKVGYPLELEIPKAVFSTSKRGVFSTKGSLPRYRLTAVVYHHGKSAAGGHYTVDLLRQDRREWIRVDDTVIRRIRPEDVAEGGSEEDPAVLSKAVQQHQADNEPKNIFDAIDNERDGGDGANNTQWSQVNGTETKKRWAGVAASTPPSADGAAGARKSGLKDNKVAYILLYENMS